MSVALAGSSSGNAVSGSLGFSIAENSIANTIISEIIDSDVTAVDGQIEVDSQSVAVVDSFAISGGVGGSYSSSNGALSVTGAGTVVTNTIANTIEATITSTTGNHRVETLADGHPVAIRADDISTIRSEAGGFSVALSLSLIHI